MKQRFSSLDVKAATLELSAALVGLRISNIYDLSSRIFLFKVAKPDVRKQFVVDAGFRCHLTEYARTTAPEPSPFISRLRKFLKSRRITGVSQVGTDRIIDFQFSDGHFHLFLEFFAAGNIILTDNEYKIIGLLRNVPAGPDQDEVTVGLQYTLDNKQNYNGVPPLSVERLKDILEADKAKADDQPAAGASKKKLKKKQAEALRRVLSHGFPEYPPLLLEHALQSVGYDTSLLPEQVLEESGRIDKLMAALQVAEEVRSQLNAADNVRGYIIARSDKGAQETNIERDSQPSQQQKRLYDDFHPFEPKQFQGVPDITILPFDGFNKAVDEFFSSVEAQKLESRLTEREATARRKLDAARKDQEKRVGALKEVQQLQTLKAQTIEENLHRVEEAMNAVNGLVAQGMDWVEIARLIEMEQGKGNPVAKTVKLPLKLYENTITLLLAEPTSDDKADELDDSEEEDSDWSSDEDEKKVKAAPKKQRILNIDVDLGLTPWANASQYYGQKKTAAVKEDKTLKASNKALKSAERKITADLKQGMKQEKPVLRAARTPFWFEKFFFFLSSEGYLVLGGRDAQQNEMLYRRHLKRGDVFVHADMKGAVPMIVKNRVGATDSPIPPGTLSQAGTFSVATSSAWDSKALMGAWWVNAGQVSKTAPTGDYVATGDVVIRGEKNHLAPGQLILGFAVLFQISPESVQNHTKHRLQDDDVPVVEGTGTEAQLSEEPTQVSGLEHYGGRGETKVEGPGSGLSEQDDRAGQEGNHSLGEILEDDHEAEEATENRNIQEPRETGQVSGEPAETSGHVSAKEPLKQETDDKDSPVQSQDVSDADEEEEVESRPSTQLQSRTSTPSVAQSTTSSKPQPQIRGKRGKNKKLAEKYKHQDEEDRELALRLLGSAPKADTSSTTTTTGSSAGAASSKTKTKADREAEIEAQKQRRRAQHDRAAQAERRRQEALERGEEITEGGNEVDEVADLRQLPSLVGTLVPGDEVVAAIPVCAPWSALGQYKYRVKLQPGTAKKGKAVREILRLWIAEGTAKTKEMAKEKEKNKKDAQEDPEEENGPPEDTESLEDTHAPTELELIKGWRDAEVVNTLPVGGVRIVTSARLAGGKSDAKGKGKKPGGGGGARKGRGKADRGSKKK